MSRSTLSERNLAGMEVTALGVLTVQGLQISRLWIFLHSTIFLFFLNNRLSLFCFSGTSVWDSVLAINEILRNIVQNKLLICGLDIEHLWLGISLKQRWVTASLMHLKIWDKNIHPFFFLKVLKLYKIIYQKRRKTKLSDKTLQDSKTFHWRTLKHKKIYQRNSSPHPRQTPPF